MIYVMGAQRCRAVAAARAGGLGPTEWTWLCMPEQLAGVSSPQVVQMDDHHRMQAHELRSMVDDRGGTWWTEFQLESGRVPREAT